MIYIILKRELEMYYFICIESYKDSFETKTQHNLENV